jgi:hypothetical protein
MIETYLTKNVFVAGGTPEITYNPRDGRRLEDEVRSYLDQSGKALSISGPTKSGKTVLVGRILPMSEAIWLYGSDLTSQEAFWQAIVDWLGLYDAVEVSTEQQDGGGAGFGGSLGVPGVAQLSGNLSASDSSSRGRRVSRRRAYSDVAREGLRTLPVPIVIDDFHYVPDSVKRDIARAIKSLLPITHVVMIAVPHEAFEAVREEPDMGGRVWQLQIEHWTPDELSVIARSGFTALNVFDHHEEIAAKLAETAFGAPFLMQQLCYDLTIANGVLSTQQVAKDLAPPLGGWNQFFERIAVRSAPPVFERLRKGPKTRGTERMERVFKDGVTTDIYGAVLRAVSLAGPKPAVSQQELVKILDRELKEAARGQQVTSSLINMSTIAEEARASGDPALVFKNDELYLLDPFLLFFLRWGTWDMESYTRPS